MKKIISVIAVLCLLCSFAASAFANDVTNTFTKDIPVNVNIDAGTFSVSVPLDTISLDSTTNGKTQSSTIKNNGNLPVVIKDISIIKNENNGWSQIDNNVPFTDYKQFKIEVSGESTPIAANSTGSYQYTVSVPPIQPARVNETIATIKVTVAVDDTFYAPLEPLEPSIEPSEPSIEPSLPQAVSPKLVSFNSDSYYKIAEYEEYSLLLHEELSTAFPNYPLTRVSVDLSGDFSLPIPNAEPTFFDLSSAEFTDYCSIVSQPSNDKNNERIYQLRDSKTVYCNTVETRLEATCHRYAIWVPTSSISAA